MKLYTRTGDKGTTGLYGGERISKDSLAVRSYGEIDELTSVLGVYLTFITDKTERDFIVGIQKELYTIMSFLARSPQDLAPVSAHILELEKKIDKLSEDLPPLHSFIIPGGSPASAWAHLARTVCRRAERSVVRYFNEGKMQSKETDTVMIYLNRLSDLLFTYARYFNEQNELLTKV